MEMTTMSLNRLALAAIAAAAIMMLSQPVRASAAGCDAREAASLASPSPLAAIRLSCPELGAIVEAFALRDLGEAVPDGDPPRRRPRIVAAGPITEDIASFAQRAQQARASGATMSDFGEALYLTAVTAGVPKAIAATRVLLDTFAQGDAQCPGLPVGAGRSL